MYSQRFRGRMTRPDLWPTKQAPSSCSPCSPSEGTRTLLRSDVKNVEPKRTGTLVLWQQAAFILPFNATLGEFCASVQGDYGRGGLDARSVPQKKNQTENCPANTSREKRK